MYSKFIRCTLALALSCSLFHGRAQGFISTRGKEIVLPDGKPFIMRGTNLGNWLVPEGYMFLFGSVNSPRLINQLFHELIGPAATDSFWNQYLENYITAADIHYIKALGMNSIRVPFNYRLFTDDHYLGQANANHGFELLDRLIGWCRAEHLYVVLDMHCAPGGQTGDNIDDGDGYPFLYNSEKDQQLATSIWQRIAAHYKNEPTVLGYDLLNEPIATYFDKAQFNPALEPLYKRITRAIRLVDKNHIIILGGAQWDSNFEPFGPPFDSKLVYQFHKYWTAPTVDVIQSYIDFSNRYHVPIYCGETGENTDQWVDSFRHTLETARIGWHYWPYKKMNNSRCVVQIRKPGGYDAIIEYAEKDRTSFAEIRKNRPTAPAAIRRAMADYLKNCRFENCAPNAGYIQALGFGGADKAVSSKHVRRNPHPLQQARIK